MKIIKEHINEKFSEKSSDPIEDMKIGGLSFDKLSVGSIIKPKIPYLSITNSKNFTYPNKGTDLPIDQPILIVNVKDYIIPGVEQIFFYDPLLCKR